jgi:hypothetical protein
VAGNLFGIPSTLCFTAIIRNATNELTMLCPTKNVRGERNLSKKLENYVHCHLCPLKDLCPYGDKNASYAVHNTGKNFMENSTRLDIATRNCPLKKLLIV